MCTRPQWHTYIGTRKWEGRWAYKNQGTSTPLSSAWKSTGMPLISYNLVLREHFFKEADTSWEDMDTWNTTKSLCGLNGTQGDQENSLSIEVKSHWPLGYSQDIFRYAKHCQRFGLDRNPTRSMFGKEPTPENIVDDTIEPTEKREAVNNTEI